MKSRRGKFISLGMVGVTACLALAGFLYWLTAGGEEAGDGSLSSGTTADATASPPATAPRPPLAAVEASPPTRIVIPEIGIDAPISVKGMGADGVMESPNGPEDVAWYTFSNKPGAGGNAVFSAHVDFQGYGPAVFARLKEMQKGDLVEVVAADGSVHSYRVVLSVSYPAESAPFEEIVGATNRDVVTLITCTGSFDNGSRQYSHRLVVRAERA